MQRYVISFFAKCIIIFRSLTKNTASFFRACLFYLTIFLDPPLGGLRLGDQMCVKAGDCLHGVGTYPNIFCPNSLNTERIETVERKGRNHIPIQKSFINSWSK